MLEKLKITHPYKVLGVREGDIVGASDGVTVEGEAVDNDGRGDVGDLQVYNQIGN